MVFSRGAPNSIAVLSDAADRIALILRVRTLERSFPVIRDLCEGIKRENEREEK
jgi:hypothetical protein